MADAAANMTVLALADQLQQSVWWLLQVLAVCTQQQVPCKTAVL